MPPKLARALKSAAARALGPDGDHTEKSGVEFIMRRLGGRGANADVVSRKKMPLPSLLSTTLEVVMNPRARAPTGPKMVVSRTKTSVTLKNPKIYCIVLIVYCVQCTVYRLCDCVCNVNYSICTVCVHEFWYP